MSQLVGDPPDERRLRADDDEIGLERSGKAEQPLAVLGMHGMATPERGDTGIAGRRV